LLGERVIVKGQSAIDLATYIDVNETDWKRIVNIQRGCIFVDHPVMRSGPLENWIAACDTILETGASRIAPGHGPVVCPDGVRHFSGRLQRINHELTDRSRRGGPGRVAAMDIPLGPDQHLALRERLVATAAATYHHLSASDVPPAEVLERMAQAHFDAA
jgi:cyclase